MWWIGRVLIFTCVLSTGASSIVVVAAERPNVLLIAVDDLNHWIGHLGRNPQTKTPNIDRLAAWGVTFASAHCVAPACEPSRCALMGGRRPWTSGCYKNGHKWKQYQAPGEGLSAQFLKSGYEVIGAGKIYHSMAFHDTEWSHYMPSNGLSNNGPGVEKMDGYLVDKTHPDLKDDDLIDWHVVDYCIAAMERKRDQPFFIACGLYKPHLPFVVPRKYYEPFPLESIKLPPHREDDLKDIPDAGIRMARPEGDHQRFVRSGRWKAAIQSYLATVSYTDMNIGRLLDAVERNGLRENTIIVLWGDHGWSFGEKQHWRKFALWEETTRTPLIWSVPGLTVAGGKSQRTVDLQSVYPTLCRLANVQVPSHVEGHDIRQLLAEPHSRWTVPAVTTHGRGNHSVRSQTHRYIRYADGAEELYDVANDPYEWDNLLADGAEGSDRTSVREQLARWLPKEEAPVSSD